MSLQSVKDFRLAISSNPDLAAKVSAAVAGKTGEESAIAISTLAKDEGFDFSAAEAAQAQTESQELSDDALNSVAGGVGNNMIGAGTEGAGFWAGYNPPAGPIENSIMPIPDISGSGVKIGKLGGPIF